MSPDISAELQSSESKSPSNLIMTSLQSESILVTTLPFTLIVLLVTDILLPDTLNFFPFIFIVLPIYYLNN